MIRVFALPAIILTVFFSALLFVIPSFAPETAVLSYYEITPDREQAIYLLDVRSGLSYFSGLVTRTGNFSMWSEDGETIATVRVNPSPASLDLLDLTTGEHQTYPLQAPAGPLVWESHPNKVAYQSTVNDGSLIVLDRETGRENSFFENVNINWMHFLPESDSLMVMTTDKVSRIGTLYEIDLTTNDITLLRENFAATHLEVLEDPFRILYSTSNQLITFSLDAPDNETVLMTLDEAEFSGWYQLQEATDTWVVYTSLRETWLLNIETGDLQRIREGLEEVYAWRVYPSLDGRSLATFDQVSDNLSTIHITQEGEQIDFSLPASIASILWSPDSRYIISPSPSTQYYSTVYVIDTFNGSYQIVDQAFLNLMWQPTPE